MVITGLSTGGAEMMLLKLLKRIDRRRFSPHVISLTTKGEIGARIEALGIPVEGSWHATWMFQSAKVHTTRPSAFGTVSGRRPYLDVSCGSVGWIGGSLGRGSGPFLVNPPQRSFSVRQQTINLVDYESMRRLVSSNTAKDSMLRSNGEGYPRIRWL